MASVCGIYLGALLLLAGCVQNQTAATPAEPAGPSTLNVADAAIAGGDPSMALSVSQSVLATDSGNVDALVHEGDAYYALGRCPAAEAAFNLALTHNPQATDAETGLGRCLLRTDPAAAESALQLAVQDDPGNAPAWNDLGIARDYQGKYADAALAYEKSLLNNPGSTATEVNLGLSLALSGNAAQALQYLGPLATSQDATPRIREDYALALVASGRPDEARQVLAIDLPPDQVDSAMAGFAEVLAESQAPPPPPPAPPPTVAAVATPPVTAAPVVASTTPRVLIAPATPPAAPPATPPATPDESTAAYTGPSPVAGAVSSSTPGPVSAPPATPPPTAGAGASGIEVQLGALDSPDDAERAFRDISGASPDLFTGKEPDIQAATVNGKTYYRLRIGGFSSTADAASFCAKVSAAGNACTLANF